MLTKLTVKDYALIESLEVDFTPGLNILTGETGAGKSILIGALGLALGERADSDSVRGGAKAATVEAEFNVQACRQAAEVLRELEVETETAPLILRREVNAAGKSRAFANDSPVNLNGLKRLGDALLDMHGQHQHQSLLYEERHLDYLDAFGHLEPVREQVSQLFSEYHKIKKQLNDLVHQEQLTREKIDLYQFQLKEIEAAGLQAGQEEELEKEKFILENTEKLFASANQAYELLYEGEGSIIERLGTLENLFSDLSAIDERQNESREAARSALAQLEETARALRQYRDRLQFDPERLEVIRDRLDLIKTLKKKYGQKRGTIEAVLEHAQSIKLELDGVEHGEEIIAKLKAEMENERMELEKYALALSSKRTEAAKKLSKEVIGQLKDLGMDKAVFKVQSLQTEDALGLAEVKGKRVMTEAWGIDQVSFLISPNPGEDLKALARIASGGEISRVMLAIKTILAEADAVPVLVFDEIDAGIGGRVAEAVGRKLKEIGRKRQVLCITHLPQIAALGDSHYVVSKQENKGRTITNVEQLDQKQRVDELARMLGGSRVTETVVKHAREMIGEKN
ncbi:DNA repair protein RecN [candidate division TA06 bacterium]|uniref:DNA repair protein RecN n=1 Tax=candidate division TA06 bacterium TaxID=2250710 RepID=A0A933IAG1_UNCT6|nr:DNA repair protein RecN [candidate division TA06 bacterium]